MQWLGKYPKGCRKRIQKPGCPQDAHAYHQANQGGHNANDSLEPVFCPFDKVVIYIVSCQELTAKVQKTRYTLAGALFTTLIGTIASVILAQVM